MPADLAPNTKHVVEVRPLWIDRTGSLGGMGTAVPPPAFYGSPE